jgi:hypothetical protein
MATVYISPKELSESKVLAELTLRLCADGFSFDEAVQLAVLYFCKKTIWPQMPKKDEDPKDEPKSEGGEA